MQAQEVMTKDLVTVAPATPISEIAKLLVQHRIGAVPVLAADGRLLGLVTQTDPGHRSETGTEKRRKWWLDIFADPDAQARDEDAWAESRRRHDPRKLLSPVRRQPG